MFADLDDDEWDVLHDAAAIIASRSATTTRTETTA